MERECEIKKKKTKKRGETERVTKRQKRVRDDVNGHALEKVIGRKSKFFFFFTKTIGKSVSLDRT